MFGCMRRIVVLVVFGLLLVVGIVAYITRSRWEPAVREKLGMRPVATTTAPAWEPVTAAGVARVRTAIATLRRPTGPAFINVQVGDLVAFAIDSAFRGTVSARREANGAEALAGENMISIRTIVNMKDVGGDGAFGPLGSLLEGDQRVEVRGRIELTGRGNGQLRIERMALGNLVLPAAAIGPLLQRIAPRKGTPGSTAAIAFVLPAAIADIRVAPGRITLYRGTR